MSDKKIFEMKLTITNDCVLKCDYCFVNKKIKISEITKQTAEKAINFFLSTTGKNKILKIYGGEPLLNFNLLKKIIPYIKRKAKTKRINLTLSLCTNAILLKQYHLDFFEKNKFQLAISFDGCKKTHDRFRKFPNELGTFNCVSKKIPLVLKKIEKRNITANMSITPSEACNIFKNFRYIISTGFDTLNLEPIYGFQKWDKNCQHQFRRNFNLITEFIFREINYGNFFFLTTVNRELKYKTLSKIQSGVCPFYNSVEIYPDGRMGFSSFFLNLPKNRQKKYIVGDINNGWISKKYLNCRFSKNSCQCKKCSKDYFDLPDESMSFLVSSIRNKLSIDLANKIKIRAKTNQKFAQYLIAAKKHICF